LAAELAAFGAIWLFFLLLSVWLEPAVLHQRSGTSDWRMDRSRLRRVTWLWAAATALLVLLVGYYLFLIIYGSR
jgi:hypothetical protein